MAEAAAPLPSFSLRADQVGTISLASSWPFEVTPEWGSGGSRGAGVRVCILDSGVESAHPRVGDIERSVAVETDEDGRAHVVEDTEGDDDAWAALVERFSRYVYAIALRGFRLSEHDAEDVFQEVFARTYEKLRDNLTPIAPGCGTLGLVPLLRLGYGPSMVQGAERATTGPPSAALIDAELVNRCRDGDDAAWAELVARFSRYVYAIAVRGFRLDENDAEDVFQEVFARTFEHLHEMREDAAVRPWIAQLARRLAIDRLRASARTTPLAEPPEQPEDEDLFVRLDEALGVQAALETLPEECREVLDRFFARDQSYRVIAESMQIPPGTIASRISRCLAKLRDRLSE